MHQPDKGWFISMKGMCFWTLYLAGKLFQVGTNFCNICLPIQFVAVIIDFGCKYLQEWIRGRLQEKNLFMMHVKVERKRSNLDMGNYATSPKQANDLKIRCGIDPLGLF